MIVTAAASMRPLSVAAPLSPSSPTSVSPEQPAGTKHRSNNVSGCHRSLSPTQKFKVSRAALPLFLSVMSFHYCWIVIKSFYDSQTHYLSECGEITVMALARLAPSRQTLEFDVILTLFCLISTRCLPGKGLKEASCGQEIEIRVQIKNLNIAWRYVKMFSHILEYKYDGRSESERERDNCILTHDMSKSA